MKALKGDTMMINFNDQEQDPEHIKNLAMYSSRCAEILMKRNVVTVKTPNPIGKEFSKTTIYYDHREMVYRYRGDLENPILCNNEHRSVCMSIISIHLGNTMALVLCDNGPNSVCPAICDIHDIKSIPGII